MFPFADIQQAHYHMEANKNIRKLVILVS
ncbi:hypothetical protein [Cytobacillus solani]|nr:hypothetical protein [Cytobacillus solani]